LEEFVGAKFYCLHGFADSNQHVQTEEKTLVVLPTKFLYHTCGTMMMMIITSDQRMLMKAASKGEVKFSWGRNVVK